ncbi:MAG: UDP-N-acetylglucosamine--N-acetylmuramyl-(pentapeptide) pyrophosphoryl-undecaprenol N-acetylglucosamine transferase, partial [Lachnospiraceae bacterium]|nr:UDP-N-acetylglucosamine--N-acetylmuramyl-(pentapeptide) pyrophosphoryl-undecaprenol N-acetylglucosamine transferase [Lachnospiraceae bacterium]
KDLLAAADIVVSRAGANAICELLALRKPNVLIPLSKNASRGDQILNANSFARQGFSAVIEEEDITDEALLTLIRNTFANRQTFIDAMNQNSVPDSTSSVIQVIEHAQSE